MNTLHATSSRRPSVGPSAAFVCERIRRIREDITAAESKMERIRIRIERDRQALFRLEARFPDFRNERQHSS